jgi:DNA (cytosine-5)-methyltransferase 1
MQTTIPTIELFAGIAGFSSLHTQPVALVEKDASCRAVLRRHHPHALILEDVRSVGAHNLPWAPVQKFGFPCQDLSVAGNRAGLKGARSGLFYEATRIADELRPDYLIWENVPGLLSSGSGRDFLAVLTELDRIGFAGGWTTVDAQFFGVAQRRCRVFGVFARRDIGAARCAEILSLAARLPWNLTPGYKKRKDVAARTRSGIEESGGESIGFAPSSFGNYNEGVGALRADAGSGSYNLVAASFDPRNVTSSANRSRVEYGLPANTLHADGLSVITAPAIALSNRGRDTGDVFETLRAGSHGALPMVCGSERAVASALTHHHGRNSGEDTFVIGSLQPHSKAHGHAMTTQQAAESGRLIVAGTLGAEHGRNRGLGNENEVDFIVPQDGPRRLTPTECERLQGFEDGYTAWGIDEQGQRVEMSDSTRYRMLGNAICKKVSAWIDSQLVRHL